MTLAAIAELLRISVQSPREAARLIMALPLPASVVWQVMVLGAAISGLMSGLQLLLFPPVDDVALPALLMPLFLAVIVFVAQVLLAGALMVVGSLFGGQGTFDLALKLMAWVQMISAFVGMLQLVLLLLVPPLASLLLFAWAALGTVLLVVFTDELHGFRSVGKGLLVLILAIFALSFLAAIVLSVAGVNLGQEVPNV